MQTLYSAFRCVLILLVLFSCNSKRNEKTFKKDLLSTQSQAIKIPDKEELDFESLHTKFINASTQQFTVSSKRVSEVTSQAGLKVMVDPTSLEREDGVPVKGNIRVSIVDVTNVNDLFRCNAATFSNGKLLASGGSYFIKMENAGCNLRIKSGKTIQVEFPVLKKEKMELFYGQRDKFDNNMNWQAANLPLVKQKETISFVNNRLSETVPFAKPLEELKEPRIFKSQDEEVYYYNKKMTLANLVNTLNKKEYKVFLQNVSRWPKDLPTNRVLDTNYLTRLYGPRKLYLLRICKNEQKEKEALEKRRMSQMAAMEKWQPQSLQGQIQKYYAPNYQPANLTSLGWLNCDMFYNQPTNESKEVEVPYAFTNTKIQYFLLYRSFNGLMNGSVELDSTTKFTLQNLPLWQEVTLLAFTKKDGVIYHAKEDFVVGGNKNLQVKFEKISTEAFEKMFGSNIRI